MSEAGDVFGAVASLPVRGAWVEMHTDFDGQIRILRRSPCGERGLKWRETIELVEKLVVAPRAGSVG